MLKSELDEHSGLPLYHQLKNILNMKIMSGEWCLDSQIPTEEELVAEYKVSRNTVRSAIAELTRQGILYRKRGVGTFVVGLKVNTYSVYSRDYPADLDDFHENVAITPVLPEEDIASLLKISRETPVFEFVRLRRVGDEGAKVLEKSYVVRSLCPDLPDDPPTGKFYDWLGARHNLHVHDWETLIEATVFTEEEGALVQAAAGSPALYYKRLNFDVQGNPVFFSTSLFRGDRFCMSSSSAVKSWIIKNKS